MSKKKINRKLLYIITLFLVILLSSVMGVYAERIIASSKVTYSNDTSGLASNNVQGAIDELYGKYVKCAKSFGNFRCFLQSLEVSETVLADDGTVDHNMRYMGKNPNNYVTFNGEEWRVIGVFNNVDGGIGTKESRVKIIKAESIGDKKWNNSDINIWKNASLNKELQASSYATNSMTDTAVWYLGDPGGDYKYTAAQAYTYERGTKVASGNDATWTGKVGLMYPSDYGFASSGCKDGAQTLLNYHNTICTGSNWLYYGQEWLISPWLSNTLNGRNVYSDGHVGINDFHVSYPYAVRPTVYLKSSVICKNCNEATAGTKENPFIID